MNTTLKALISTVGLFISVTANAAVYDLGTITPQTTEPVFDFNISGSFGDSYNFTVNSPFAFTSSVDGFNMLDSFNTSVSLSGGSDLFGQDTFTPITGLSNAYRSGITEKLLSAGSYSFNIGGTSAGGMYTGSFTVGRPGSVSAVPEEDSLALMMVGFSIFGLSALRRKKARA